MGADDLALTVPEAATRLLAAVNALDASAAEDRDEPLDRLEAALGPELADRLVSALTDAPRVYRGPG